MQDRGRKPPIDMRDFEESQQQRNYSPQGPQPGGLSYSNGGGGGRYDDGYRNPPLSPRGKSSGGNSINMVQVLLSAILGIAGSVFVFFSIGAGKADLQALDAKIAGVVAAVNTQTTQITNLTTSNFVKAETLSTYATKAELGNYATTTALAGVTKPDMSSYYTKADIDALLLKKADKGGGGGSSPGGGTINTGSYTVTLSQAQLISTSSATSPTDLTITLLNTSTLTTAPYLLFTLTPVSVSYYPTASLGTYTASFTGSGLNIVDSIGTRIEGAGLTGYTQKVTWTLSGLTMNPNQSVPIWARFKVYVAGSDVVTWNLAVKAID